MCLRKHELRLITFLCVLSGVRLQAGQNTALLASIVGYNPPTAGRRLAQVAAAPAPDTNAALSAVITQVCVGLIHTLHVCKHVHSMRTLC